MSKVIDSWTNGSKATVSLVADENGDLYIRKEYRAAHYLTFFREWFSTVHLSKKIDCVPKVIEMNSGRRTLKLTYIDGDRLLEWALTRFAPQEVNLDDFRSFHGLESNPIVQETFRRFRESDSLEARKVREAISASYRKIHDKGWIHGSADPRNLILAKGRIYLIDFDHARPSLNPSRRENLSLKRWFGG